MPQESGVLEGMSVTLPDGRKMNPAEFREHCRKEQEGRESDYAAMREEHDTQAAAKAEREAKGARPKQVGLFGGDE